MRAYREASSSETHSATQNEISGGGGIKGNGFVNNRNGTTPDTEGGERNNRRGVQTRRIRPIAFDIIKDVGISGSGATVPPRQHPHVVRGGGSRLRPV